MKKILEFLELLKANNNREWFNDNKKLYDDTKSLFEEFVNILILKIHEFDKSIDVTSAKECMFRIYRDIRFSKNKEPYKTNMGAYIAKGGRKSNLAGYYIHFEPQASFAGGGVYCPQPKELKKIREDIFSDSSKIRSIIETSNFNTVFPELYGEKLKTAPKGFSKDFQDIELLNYKSYTVVKSLTDEDIFKNDFLEVVLNVFKTQKPFNDYLNNILK